MDPDLCPPWWPDLLWWLLHHKPDPPPPWWEKVDDAVLEATETILAGLAAYHQAAMLGREAEGLRAKVQTQALDQMTDGFETLASQRVAAA